MVSGQSTPGEVLVKGLKMEIFEFNNRLLEVLTVPALIALVLLAVLTMRAVILRDRAMMFGDTDEAEARRRAYEQRWRNNRAGV